MWRAVTIRLKELQTAEGNKISIHFISQITEDHIKNTLEIINAKKAVLKGAKMTSEDSLSVYFLNFPPSDFFWSRSGCV
jgi:hypothetical protein